MTKCTLIATCLLNSRMVSRLADGEAAVRTVLKEKFPDDRFECWNTELSPEFADQEIKNVGIAKDIGVDRFIKQLWSA